MTSADAVEQILAAESSVPLAAEGEDVATSGVQLWRQRRLSDHILVKGVDAAVGRTQQPTQLDNVWAIATSPRAAVIELTIAFAAIQSSGPSAGAPFVRRHRHRQLVRGGTIAFRECERRAPLLGHAGFRIARRIQRCHARVDADAASPIQEAG